MPKRFYMTDVCPILLYLVRCACMNFNMFSKHFKQKKALSSESKMPFASPKTYLSSLVLTKWELNYLLDDSDLFVLGSL